LPGTSEKRAHLGEIPAKQDGFQYAVEEYVANWIGGGNWHMPDTVWMERH
jgi:hypothetical protein